MVPIARAGVINLLQLPCVRLDQKGFTRILPRSDWKAFGFISLDRMKPLACSALRSGRLIAVL